MSQAQTERFESCTEIRRRREQTGLSRAQVARRLRWGTELVAQFERGSAVPSLVETMALARLFEERNRLRGRRRRHDAIEWADAPFVVVDESMSAGGGAVDGD